MWLPHDSEHPSCWHYRSYNIKTYEFGRASNGMNPILNFIKPEAKPWGREEAKK
jgi:hypothetical protein